MEVIRNLTALAVVAHLLAACDQNTATQVAGPVIAASAPTSKPATIDEWRQSIKFTYEESQVKKTEEGVTEFVGLFPKKGGVFAFGKHDVFHKAYIFKPASTQMQWDLGPNVRCYVVVPEGMPPSIVISPQYWGKSGYIFLNKLAILVDGELLFEKAFQFSDVKRGRYGVGVNETANIVLSGDALLPFRKITNASTVAIRLTGDREYVNLKNDGVKPIDSFKDSIIESLFIYDSIHRATEGHLPVLASSNP
jgi:hypothetical protein